MVSVRVEHIFSEEQEDNGRFYLNRLLCSGRNDWLSFIFSKEFLAALASS
jgi:hypothetical protein